MRYTYNNGCEIVMKNDKYKLVVGILLAIGVVILCLLLMPVLKTVNDPEKFKAYVDSFGIGGFAMLFVVQILQVVVALIPGEVVEFFAGSVYGWFGGMLFCLAGIAVGEAAVFSAVRFFGKSLAEKVAGNKTLNKFKFLQNEKRLKTVIFILFCIPGTPKDLLTYFVPLTKIKMVDFLIITLVARVPSIVTSTYAGLAYAERNFGTVALIYCVTTVLFACGYTLYSRWSNHKNVD